MTWRQLIAGCLAVVIAACQGQSPSPSPSGPAGEPSATAGPPATPIPELLSLTLDESGPIIVPADGPDDAQYALPAAATRARDGTYLLVIAWFGGDNDPPMITLATSRDTRTWDVGTDPMLAQLRIGWPPPGLIPSALLEVEGGWQLYGWAADRAREGYFGSWRASAPDLGGPWVLDRDRVLGPGTSGTWDSRTAALGSVKQTPDGFAGWYEGQGPGSGPRGDIGHVTSTDGLSWEKFDDPATTSDDLAESDPVIGRGICGLPTEQALFQPQVEPAPTGGYLAAFGAFAASREQMDVFGAVSADGARWSCGTPEPLLRFEDIPASQGIHSLASFPLDDGRVGLVVESLGEEHSELWLATMQQVD